MICYAAAPTASLVALPHGDQLTRFKPQKWKHEIEASPDECPSRWNVFHRDGISSHRRSILYPRGFLANSFLHHPRKWCFRKAVCLMVVGTYNRPEHGQAQSVIQILWHYLVLMIVPIHWPIGNMCCNG